MIRISALLDSLDERANTILKVATEIVRQQQAFLMHGVNHLRPMNLGIVADAINMSQSTVSRVTSNKLHADVAPGVPAERFLHGLDRFGRRRRCPFGQIGAPPHPHDDQSGSAEAVLSDDAIVDRLKKEGVDIARRTVAKYREAMNIPSSVPRRREKRALAKAKGL